MAYYHCPKTFRKKPYGCGYGPVNATAALLDLHLTCPTCKMQLKKIRSAARNSMEATQEKFEAAAAAEQLFGAGAGADYFASHKHRQ